MTENTLTTARFEVPLPRLWDFRTWLGHRDDISVVGQEGKIVTIEVTMTRVEARGLDIPDYADRI